MQAVSTPSAGGDMMETVIISVQILHQSSITSSRWAKNEKFVPAKAPRQSVLAPALALALALALAPAAAAAAEASLAAGPPAPNGLYLRGKAHIIVFEEQPEKAPEDIPDLDVLRN